MSVSKKAFLLLFVACLCLSSIVRSQNQSKGKVYNYNGQELNAITTAVPFLNIAPDSRSGAMGDVGVALSPDANSMHWNPAKYAFVKRDFGMAISYTPWLRALIGDISLSYLAGYKRLGNRERSAIGFSLLYFSLGNIDFTDINGHPIKSYSPNEFAIDGAYAFKLSKNLSGGIALRYIYSALTGGITQTGAESHPGWSIAGDICTYYQNEISLGKNDAQLGLGANISNIGSKISYTDDAEQNFIPINMRLGGSLKMDLDNYNSITFAADVNKLLVPTPPVYSEETTDSIIAGKDPDVPVMVGFFQSFVDAPGGFQEEMREIMYSVGVEYWYAKQFAVRAGYFHEHQTKGNRKFFTVGIGLRLSVFGLDFAYLVPTNFQNSPLQNTLRFSLTFDFDNLGTPTNKRDEDVID